MFRVSNTTLANVDHVTDTLTATAGGTKAAALALLNSVNRISVCATGGDSVLAPAAFKGCSCLIINDGAASCNVFGQGTDTIDGVATATAKALANAKRMILVAVADGAWVSIVGA